MDAHAKPVAETALTMAVMMMPADANPQGQVHGGTIMKLIDTAAAAVAHRHARSHVATARIDSVNFLAPVEVGDLVTFKASMNAAWHTSMEVGVRVETENLLTGKVTHTSSAYVVLVALNAIDMVQMRTISGRSVGSAATMLSLFIRNPASRSAADIR